MRHISDEVYMIGITILILLISIFFMLTANHLMLRDIRSAIQEQNRLLVSEASVSIEETPKVESPKIEHHNVVTVTAYVSKDKRHTATLNKPIPGWTCAVSRDLAHWLGGKVWIDGVGVRHVSDLTHERLKKRVDVLVGKTKEVAEIGNKDRKVVFLGKG